jgi:hypothetical protein
MRRNRVGKYDRIAQQRFHQHERTHESDSGEAPPD